MEISPIDPAEALEVTAQEPVRVEKRTGQKQERPPQIDKTAVLTGAKRQLEGLLFSIFPSGFSDPQGRKFYIGGLDGQPGQSMDIHLQGEKAGLWYDFATGEGGDLLDLWKRVHGLRDFPEILRHLAGAVGVQAEVIRRAPVKKQAPRRNLQEGRLVASYTYQSAAGRPIVRIDRFEHESDGKTVKTFRPTLHDTGSHKFPEPRPLYNLPGFSGSEEIVIAEGEKSADALIDAGIAATTAMGGAKAPFEKTDWAPLAGKTVFIWPDHDEAGASYAEMLVKNLPAHGVRDVKILPIDPDRPQKWDAADAARDGEDVVEVYARMKAKTPAEVSRAISANDVADAAAAAITTRFPDAAGAAGLDVDIIKRMIEGSFWSGGKARLFILTEDGQLNQFTAQEGWRFLCRRFGQPVDADEILRHVAAGSEKPLTDKDVASVRKEISSLVSRVVMDHIKAENQREKIDWGVDMFAKGSRVQILDRRARVILEHKPFIVEDTPCPRVIADYKEHFPELDSVLQFIVASRFALDRKKSYLWLLAASNWGKGFFLGALKHHGIVVEMSVKEIEATFEGKPVGKSPEDFIRAMVLAVDEFKTVKAELKQLQSTIALAPKYQLVSEVEIYSKLFMSAESVASLVGEHGVEDQFTTRMSVLTGQSSITNRELYRADTSKYFRSVCQYVGDSLNRLIEEYRKLGKTGAEARADRFLSSFIDRHGLGVHYGRLSDSYLAIADEFVEWVRMQVEFFLIDGEREFVQHAGKAIETFLEASYSTSEVTTLKKRRSEIIMAASVDQKSAAYPYRIQGHLKKLVRIG